ncbi:M16 family metallopeptidase [Calidifontibacter indicus]|uniref:Putative Zn-dependent peptidase n=1 Tax=Calidifontibacter indicus TaxID=419650 RepID=A0A3D9URD0_9MICO|nr:pitrilysin family protein [Calidifontibacter indicus]REF31877.1 putative Zn-dependent peptidase [Calidifontibacter indicus]
MSIARPDVRPPKAWAFPEAERHRLSNGLQVALYPLPGQHVTSTRINIPVPLAAEPRDREGVATIVSRTMDEGTASHTADEMAELFESNGVGLNAGVAQQGLWVDLEATTRNVGTAFGLALECLTEPVFPENEVNRHRQQRLSQIDQELADPGYRGTLEFVRTFYTPTSRASRPSGGSRESLAGLTRDDCVAFHRQWVRPDDAFVVVAGDFDPQAMLTELDGTLGRWSGQGTAPMADAPTDAPADDRGRVVFVHRPGSVQTEIQYGWVGPARENGTQWAPHPVLSYVIGGTPHARIDSVLREDKGYTYGMRGSFRPRSGFGQFVASGSVRGDATPDALRLLGEIFAQVDEGITADELREGVDFLSMTAPARYATADSVADEAASLQLVGLDTDFITDYLAAMRSLTVDDVNSAWRQWSSQPRTIVLVGDADKYADQVDALGLGELTIV